MYMKNYIFSFVLVSFLACTAGKKSEQNAIEAPKADSPQAKATTNTPQAEATKIGMQALIEAYLKKTGIKITLTKKDFVNGYAEFRFTETAIQPTKNCQFAYYTTQKDREILAVTVPRCMQGGCWTELTFYEMINGELTENQNVIEGVKDGMISFYNLVRLHCEDNMTAEEKRMRDQAYPSSYYVWIDLPQQGTTIKITKETFNNQQKQIVAELQFNDKMGTFKFVKR